MKNYSVIGNPIDHSLSPKLQNYWINKNNLDAVYTKLKLNKEDLNTYISKLRQKEIEGINITVPFKVEIINYLDELSLEAQKTQSVNTVYLKEGKVIGHNTDIYGFEKSFTDNNFNLLNKKVLILGAGGVVPSIIFALYKMNVSKISICNRTKSKAKNLISLFKDIIICDWGDIPEFDLIINATSIGLNKDDDLELDFSHIGKNKFFYDVIYNPKETNFLKLGKKLGNKIQNGKMMFIHQAAASFKIWHGIDPTINNEVIGLLDQ